ncbi:MAG: hypothetical protein Athens101410_74 [Parcubacteria group bacterium Athens1014_10]|nr:MAG: hypothetical protein Athens101410_74 [Parcubacteria group bacterium Athens1014_10]TSD06100.1 MAG: hypothetical protein Athens071412_74 [Parcubacteria group bacterium Athens0714_12]
MKINNNLKSIKREKQRLKIKYCLKGGTLAGQKRKMETNKFYERKKKT